MCRLSIENPFLRVEIAQTGGNLTSVYEKEKNKELLWQGDPQAWRFQDVVIFPLIGLPRGGYDVQGKTYQFRMPHGVARWEKFDVEEHTADRLVLRLESNEETLRRYPFHFCLRLIYQLTGRQYSLTYAVSNPAGEKMPYQVGAHAGFQTAGDEVTLQFEREEPIYHYPYDDVLHRPARLLAQNGRLTLSKEIFEEKRSLVLPRPRSAFCTVTRPDGIKLRYGLGDATSLTIWGFANGGHFLCVEPWWGICEGEDTPRELAQKELLCWAGKQENRHTYTCEIL